MTLSDVMSHDVVSVTPDTSLMEIRNLLHERGFHHLLVMRDQTLAGIISDRDVLEALSPFLDTYSESPRDVRALARPASDIMRTDPTTAEGTMSIEKAAAIFLNRGISCLPVLEDGEVRGIVTTKDLLRHYAGMTSNA